MQYKSVPIAIGTNEADNGSAACLKNTNIP